MKIPYIGPYPMKQAKDGDAGYDIATNESKRVFAGTSASFSTGLFMAIPKGYYGAVSSRSGLAFEFKIETGAGTIDSGYRGEIKILVYNNGPSAISFEPGDRIAQIIILERFDAEWSLVDSLDETERGKGGFGHTGVKQDPFPDPFYWGPSEAIAGGDY